MKSCKALKMEQKLSAEQRELVDWHFENELRNTLDYLAAVSTDELMDMAESEGLSPAGRLITYELVSRAVSVRTRRLGGR